MLLQILCTVYYKEDSYDNVVYFIVNSADIKETDLS